MPELASNTGTYINPGTHHMPFMPLVRDAAMLAIFVAVIAATVYFSLHTTSEAHDVDQTVESFLNSVSTHDFSKAYGYLSRSRQDEVSEARFEAAFTADASYTAISDFKRVDLDKTPASTYEYSGRVTYEDGAEGALRASLVREDGTWRLDAIEIRR